MCLLYKHTHTHLISLHTHISSPSTHTSHLPLHTHLISLYTHTSSLSTHTSSLYTHTHTLTHTQHSALHHSISICHAHGWHIIQPNTAACASYCLKQVQRHSARSRCATWNDVKLNAVCVCAFIFS